MKSLPSGLASHYALPWTTLSTCLRIESSRPDSDSVPIGITTVDIPVTVDGLIYRPGLDITNLVSTAGLAVDNLDTSVLKINNILEDADLAAGFLDNAEFTIFECNYMAPADGINVLKRGTTGQAQINEGLWTIEFRSLKQAFQQSLGAITSQTCRATLGDSACKIDLTPFTYGSTVTSVTSRQVFTDSARTEDDDWFVNGYVVFDTGANANPNYARKVKLFAGGQFTLTQAMPFAVLPGDTFTAVAGCQKRLTADCKTKFNNVLNFQGEPHLPGLDGLTSIPDIPDGG